MPRYKLTIEYDGRAFVGWQRQSAGLSVQGVLEQAAERFVQQACTVYGAGRTDAGVHALGQAAHLDLPKSFDTETVRDALNHHVRPHAIAIVRADMVGDTFHARFDAVGRRYLYRLQDRRAPLTLEAGRVWRIPQSLDARAMHEAAQCLVGRHDFTTFRDSQCQADSPVKTLDQITVTRAPDASGRADAEVHIRCEARSFLHRQVRSMAGALVEVGRGRWRAEDVRTALEACDRSACAVVAPPDGLYLAEVRYPDDADEAVSLTL